MPAEDMRRTHDPDGLLFAGFLVVDGPRFHDWQSHAMLSASNVVALSLPSFGRENVRVGLASACGKRGLGCGVVRDANGVELPRLFCAHLLTSVFHCAHLFN